MVRKVSRWEIKVNSKMESKGEARNELGIREPAGVPRERMEKLRRDCKMSEQDPEAEVREAGREIQALQDATVTTKESGPGPQRGWLQVSCVRGSLRPALCATVPLAHSRSGDLQILQNMFMAKVALL